MESQISGSVCYRNWKAALLGREWDSIYEYPVFTDTQVDVRSDIRKQFGPYELFWLDPLSGGKRLDRPVFTLRAYHHLENNVPALEHTRDEHYSGGVDAEEIAALLSLCLGIRLKAGDVNRAFFKDGESLGIPVGGFKMVRDPAFILNSHRGFVLPSALKLRSLQESDVLYGFPFRSEEETTTFLRAARMYQEAVWLVESVPELSWILLTSAVETVANHWKQKSAPPVERMQDSKPELETVLRNYAKEGCEDELVEEVASQIADYMGAKKKFKEFIDRFLPSAPSVRPAFAQHKWDKSTLSKTIGKIYDYRSKALHSGKPFPAPMCEPPYAIGKNGELAEIPMGFGTAMKGSFWEAKDMPVLFHTFEYIARHAILNWWKSIAVASDQGAT